MYYRNRALCQVKRQQWPSVVADCEKAMKLDERSIKAYYFSGMAMSELDPLSMGVERLHKGGCSHSLLSPP